jgi:hypothetical protein
MAERVSVVHGKNPVILIAPHGFDDTNTDIMTEYAALECGGNAVINRGWERDATVDVLNDKANCNNIKHAKHNVVKDEFYDPIIGMVNRLTTKNPKIYVFHVHGCGNDIRKKTGENLSVVMGCGDGKPQRITCKKSTRELFTWLIEKDMLWLPAIANAGSRFAGWDMNNLLQMWRPFYPRVSALQLEFVTAVRNSKADAEVSGRYLGDQINNLLASDGILAPPPTYSYFKVNI